LEDGRPPLVPHTGENPLHVETEVSSALGSIVFPRVQPDGSMRMSYRSQWSPQALRKREFVGPIYCCWRMPLARDDVRLWLRRFTVDITANGIYFLGGIFLWLLQEKGALWQWWVMLVGAFVSVVVVLKNVSMFYQEISPLIDTDTLVDFASEAVESAKRRLDQEVRDKLGEALAARPQKPKPKPSAGKPAAAGGGLVEPEQEASLERFVKDALHKALDMAAERATADRRLSALPPWVCQARARFLVAVSAPLVVLVLLRSAVDFVGWPSGASFMDMESPALPDGPIYTCWDTVCTSAGEEGFCEGAVYYARMYQGEGTGGPFVMLKDVKQGAFGPFADLDAHGKFRCQEPVGFPPVDHDMHCICDGNMSQGSARSLLEGKGDDVAAFGFKVILRDVAINAVIAAFASWPVVRWFSNFALASMEHKLWILLERNLRGSFDIQLFQKAIDSEFSFEMNPPKKPPPPPRPKADGCCVM